MASLVQSSDFMTLNILQLYIVKYINCIIIVLKFDYDLCDNYCDLMYIALI